MADNAAVATAGPVPAQGPRGLFEAIPGLKQVLLVFGVAAAVAAAVWLVLWSQGQSYTVIYGQLSDRETQQVMDALTASGVEYKLNAAGSVMVPEAKLQEARIKLASQGLPQSDSMGIEMIQKESALGTSSLMETARYQSMLETELARTIGKVQGVQAARVHLALPKASVFLRDRRKATASVMLQLYPGRKLDQGQVGAIVHLVASSVPDLEAADVTLIDQQGTLLNSPDDGGEGAISTREFELTHKTEDSYQRRIMELLEPIVGPGRVKATVTADMDFTITEQTRENYDPQKTAVRSEQLANDERKGGDSAQGIPGALSNQPPGTAGAPVTAQGNTATSTSPTSTSSRTTKNYEVDRVLSYVKQPVGSLKRLSVGVVLDDWQKPPEADGKVTTAPMTDADIKRFTELVKESIGFRTDRGDQLSVINQAFKQSAPIGPMEGVSFLQQPWLATLGKQLVGVGLVLVIAFLVLRPLMKTLTKSIERPAGGQLTDQSGGGASAAGKGAASSIKLQPSFEQQVAAARTLVVQDPKRAAQVVKEWVAADS